MLCFLILEPSCRWIVVKSSVQRRTLRWWVFCLWASASNEGGLVKWSRPLCFSRPRTGFGGIFHGRISKETWNLCPNSLVLETHWLFLTVNQSHYCAQKRTRWTSLRPCLHGANLDPRKLAHMLPLDHGCWLFCILGCSFFGYIPTEAHARWVEGFAHLCSAYILSILLSAGYPWCLQSEFCWSIDKWPKTQICDSPTSDSQIKNCHVVHFFIAPFGIQSG